MCKATDGMDWISGFHFSEICAAMMPVTPHAKTPRKKRRKKRKEKKKEEEKEGNYHKLFNQKHHIKQTSLP